MRQLRLDPPLAQALARLRADAKRRGIAQAPRELGAVVVPLHAIEAIERELGVTLPDPVLAYVAAGVSAWGDGPVRLSRIAPRTLELHEDGLDPAFVVFDDDSNGNFIAFRAGDPDPDQVWFLEHGIEPSQPMSLLGTLSDGGSLAGVDAPPFEVTLDPTPPPAPPVRYARHPKFGRGEVLAEVDDVVTVRFEGVGEKRLKRGFLTFE